MNTSLCCFLWQSGNTVSVIGRSGTNNVMTVVTGQALIVPHFPSYAHTHAHTHTHTHTQRDTHTLIWLKARHTYGMFCNTSSINRTSGIYVSDGDCDVHHEIFSFSSARCFFLLVAHLSVSPFLWLRLFTVVIQCVSLPSPLLEQGDNYRVSELRGDAHQHL